MAVWPNINGEVYDDPGTTSGVTFKISHMCCHCHMGFKENQMVKFKGEWYGISCGCYKDAIQLQNGGK
jgi:hypothetical protein